METVKTYLLKGVVNEMTTNVLDGFAADCFQLAAEKGFWKPLTEVGDTKNFLISNEKYLILKKLEKLALIMSEGGEAVEGVRKPGESEHIPGFTKEEEELADIIIRCFDYAGGFNLRLGAAFVAKMEFNKSRPDMHGKLA